MKHPRVPKTFTTEDLNALPLNERRRWLKVWRRRHMAVRRRAGIRHVICYRLYVHIEHPEMGMGVYVDESGNLFRADTLARWQPTEEWELKEENGQPIPSHTCQRQVKQ